MLSYDHLHKWYKYRFQIKKKLRQSSVVIDVTCTQKNRLCVMQNVHKLKNILLNVNNWEQLKEIKFVPVTLEKRRCLME